MVLVILSDTTVNIGDVPIWLLSPVCCEWFSFTMQIKLRKGAWGKDTPSFHGERRPLGASLTPFPKQLLLLSYFSCFTHFWHWEYINIIQALWPSPERHCTKSDGLGWKALQNLLAPHETRNPTLIPIWTAISASVMS